MFVRLKKYTDLITFCFREQKRRQDAEYQVSKLLADNETLGNLVMHYKRKADRLEYAIYHPKGLQCRFKKVEFTK